MHFLFPAVITRFSRPNDTPTADLNAILLLDNWFVGELRCAPNTCVPKEK